MAEALADAGRPDIAGGRPGLISIHPRRILVFGIEEGGPGNRLAGS